MYTINAALKFRDQPLMEKNNIGVINVITKFQGQQIMKVINYTKIELPIVITVIAFYVMSMLESVSATH